MNDLSPKEQYELKREEKLRDREKSQQVGRGRRLAKRAALTLITLAVIGFGVWFLGRGGGLTDPTAICIEHAKLVMHIHPRLEVRIKGEVQEIPANIGVLPTCMRPLHTHDGSGTLHVEFPTRRDVPLAEFFRVWEKPFNREQIFEFRNGPEGTVKMFVNGEANEEFENYIIHDEDRIEIIYAP